MFGLGVVTDLEEFSRVLKWFHFLALSHKSEPLASPDPLRLRRGISTHSTRQFISPVISGVRDRHLRSPRTLAHLASWLHRADQNEAMFTKFASILSFLFGDFSQKRPRHPFLPASTFQTTSRAKRRGGLSGPQASFRTRCGMKKMTSAGSEGSLIQHSEAISVAHEDS